jgi:hypothetical protein
MARDIHRVVENSHDLDDLRVQSKNQDVSGPANTVSGSHAISSMSAVIEPQMASDSAVRPNARTFGILAQVLKRAFHEQAVAIMDGRTETGSAV